MEKGEVRDLKRRIIHVLSRNFGGVRAQSIAMELGIGETTARKYLRQLKEKGWVKTVDGPGCQLHVINLWED